MNQTTIFIGVTLVALGLSGCVTDCDPNGKDCMPPSNPVAAAQLRFLSGVPISGAVPPPPPATTPAPVVAPVPPPPAPAPAAVAAPFRATPSVSVAMAAPVAAPAPVATEAPATAQPIAVNIAKTPYDTALQPTGVHPLRSSLEGAIWMQADKAEQNIRTAANIVGDEALNAYVRGVVCKLAGPYCSEFRTYVVRVPDFNASMMPNGVMQVWTGLLLRVHNEAQLSAVLGHEIGHYLQRHSVQRAEDVYNKTNALVFVQLAMAGAGVGAAGDLVALATLGSISSFSRANESEADEIGLRLMVGHGYDPREAPKIWDQLMAEQKADKNYTKGSLFFASHPPTEDRSARLNGMAAYTLPQMPSADLGRERFLAAVEPYRASFLQDEMAARHIDRLEVLLQQLADDGIGLGVIRYYQGEVYRVRNAPGDADRAIEFYKMAQVEPDAPAVVYRGLGQVLQRKGSLVEAKQQYRLYLEKAPDAPDQGIIKMLIGAGS